MLDPGAAVTHLLLEFAEEIADVVLELDGQRIDELGAVGVLDLQPVVAGVGDVAQADHLLDVLHVAAGDDGDVDIGAVGQPLQDPLRFVGDEGQIRVRGQRRQRPVVIQQQRQFLRVPDVLGQVLVVIVQRHRDQ